MRTPFRRAPKDLPPAVSDLVAEGGNVLAADDATIVDVTACAQRPARRLQPAKYSFDADIAPADEAIVPAE